MNDVDFIQLIADAGPSFMLALFIFFLATGKWFVTRRELDRCETRLTDVKAERDEYKNMVLRSLRIGERVTSLAEGRRE